MIIGKIDALMSLVPTAEWHLKGDGTLDWLDKSVTEPSSSAIDAEVVRLQADYDNKKYQRDRAVEYPSVVDQLDKMFHSGFQAWKDEIQKVKEKYPNP